MKLNSILINTVTFLMLWVAGTSELNREFKIGQTFLEEVIDNEPRLLPAFMYGIHVSLRKTLKCFLELPGLLTEILKYTHG